MILWTLVPFATLWTVWKDRNVRVFKGSPKNVKDVESLVFVCIAKWVSKREGFDSLKSIRHFAQMRGFSSWWMFKKSTVDFWLCPIMGSELNFNVDGAATGKPELVGVCGGLCNS